MDLQKVIAEFFNFDIPCPKEVPMCNQIRNSFKTELTALETRGGCTNCAKTKLKSRFIEAIFKEISNK
jgi:hypothetical protein